MRAPATAGLRVGDDDERSQHGEKGEPQQLSLPARQDSKVAERRERRERTTSTNQQSHHGASPETAEGAAAAAIARNDQVFAANAQAGGGTIPSINTSLAPVHPALVHRSPTYQSPAAAGLHLQTNVDSAHIPVFSAAMLQETPTSHENAGSTELGWTSSRTSPVHIAGAGASLRTNKSTSSMASSLSPGSTLPSPALNAMADLTPLPSPIVGSELSIPWRRAQGGTPNRSRQSSLDGAMSRRHSSLPSSPASPPKRKKGYGSLVPEATLNSNAAAAQENQQMSKKGHGRNRSISDFVPPQLTNARPRHVTVGSGDVASLESQDYRMQREEYLATQRGLTVPEADISKSLPTPPPSSSSVAESDETDDSVETPHLEDGTPSEYLDIHCGIRNRKRKFRQLRQLGQGTFSKVMLATSQQIPAHPTPEIEDTLDPHKLVAVKIVDHGPAGGADEERIEHGLKREVEMLKSMSHPSLIHLKACEHQPSRTLLVLTYCPGGDLFDLASGKRDVLTPAMVQRMFAELVSAVRYLHGNWIVHRDIKLENVLVNLPLRHLQALGDPRSYATPIVTLTDLGLSRRIPEPPESPFLTTRCGSEDYAAPEILLGQQYDGRQTDAWALGVLLYALMEGRLPFDCPPGKPERSRNTHRIARCDWIWCRFGDEDGEWDASRAEGFVGAEACVEGLLKKVRMGRKSLEEIERLPWLQEGIKVPGGLKMRAVDGDDELS